ncbi:TPR repeat-containing protein [Yoonia tamlensis]|uniref:TPR repeat-containing protein n=1 Tax=Yoonia tamlensis TaxID=390270 RepID=A0A1I6HZP2_9RHOB|nr:tetratricopeptide repeat protein [Yoonia tamlensis]SFR59864.1 TPR repeat-containing protein [Yoonia tamlensis]
MLKPVFFVALTLTSFLSPHGALHAEPDAGAYLAGRQAVFDSDFTTSARYLAKGLLADPSNEALLELSMTANVALGLMEAAAPPAQAMADLGLPSQVAHIVLQVADIKEHNWDGVFLALEQGRGISPLIDGIAQAWAHLGQGDMGKASAAFDRVIATDGLAIYGMTHKAYALATVGDFEGAEAVFTSRVAGGMRYNRNSGIAHIQILSQLDRNDDALKMLALIFGTNLDPELAQMHSLLSQGESLAYDAVATPQQGIAEVYHVTAGAVQGDAPDAYTLMFARAAHDLWPENSAATLMTASLLENLEQYELSNAVYTSVAREDPAFYAAELGRADVLQAGGRIDAAIEVLDALSRSHPDMPEVFANLGDTLRQNSQYREAITAYTRALDLYPDDSPAKWFIYYTRGICGHQTDDWPAAEADFRAALALQPDHPQVLNYLGYSLVERGEKLDEALGMLETAADARPDSGAIIDSLGWVLFQLRRYEEAVGLLESAAELEPVDPVVNDHLGDVYWAVGRTIEARFQWHRALSLNPSETDAARIRDKLDRGLDLVLIDEGLAPVRVASGND